MMPPRVLVSGPKPCGGNYTLNLLSLFLNSLLLKLPENDSAHKEESYAAKLEKIVALALSSVAVYPLN